MHFKETFANKAGLLETKRRRENEREGGREREREREREENSKIPLR